MATILYTIFISPLELVLEVLFELIFRILKSQPRYVGFAIIGVSIAVSLLSLPLYRRAEILQRKAREKQKQMERWISHIKRTFKGNERFMMLQQYYKLNNYSPLCALECAIPLLLQIPFFTAAYHFLSHLEVLKGTSFWIFKDLGAPDSLFYIGSFSINVLPILMTAFNCISALLYLRGFAFKDKFQTYGMAAVFLVLLYKSPSGLVLYWTCNNIFSLVKNIFYKLKHPKETAYILSAAIGTLLTAVVILSGILNSRKKLIAVLLFQVISILPLTCYLAKNYINVFKKRTALLLGSDDSNSFGLFFLAGIFLTILLGILIPSAVIASSPAEFVNLQDYHNPFLFLINSTCYAIGFFLVWMGIVRHMLPQSTKPVLNMLLWIASGICLLNYMCFGRNLGTLSPLLVFKTRVYFSTLTKLINILLICGLSIILIALFRFKRTVLSIYVILILCVGSISVYHVYTGQKELRKMAYIKDISQGTEITAIIPLSRNGKNVIVFMLDRAISGYIPYFLEEKPILKEQFAGFTYYPNTLSFGRHTNFGAPPLYGGYEYTPTEMNKRSSELLADKHDEALKMLPILFYQNNYEVTVCDPPLAGYKGVSDLSIYSDYPNMNTHILSGAVQDKELELQIQKKPLNMNKRNFFCYSIFKVLPPLVSKIMYDRGKYFHYTNISTIPQKLIDDYSVLDLLPQLSNIDDSQKNTFLTIQNSLPHQEHLLQMPDYELSEYVNNRGYKTAADGHIIMSPERLVSNYHVNMATFILLGKWFDYMREKGVYDNTKIILVADHGCHYMHHFDNMLIKKIHDKAIIYEPDKAPDSVFDVSGVNPLLMVKDFNATEFTTSNEFMTQADTPSLAVKDVIKNPVNPFTGKEISNKEKTSHPQVITTSRKYRITENNGTVYDTSDGDFLSVHDDIFNPDNWAVVGPGTTP